MRPSWLHILSGKQFEEAFENTQRRKIKQMQPMWFRILSVNHIWGLIFKHTVEISQNKCSQCVFGSFWAGNLRTQMKTHSGKKSNKCNQCEYACSDPSGLKTYLKTCTEENSKQIQPMWLCIYQADHLRRHLKTHSREMSNKCKQCSYALSEAGNLRSHLKGHHGGKSDINQCDHASHLRINQENTHWRRVKQMQLVDEGSPQKDCHWINKNSTQTDDHYCKCCISVLGV